MRFSYLCKRALIVLFGVLVVLVIHHNLPHHRQKETIMSPDASMRMRSFEQRADPTSPTQSQTQPQSTQQQQTLAITSVDTTLPEVITHHKAIPHHEQGTTWSNEFCSDFFSNRFTERIVPCEGHAHRVVCYGSPYDDKMGSCMLNNIVMDSDSFYKTMFDDKDNVRSSKSLWFNEPSNFCSNPQFEMMDKKMMGGDYVKRITQTTILTYPQAKCSRHINGTTFMFMGFDDHIYFKFLSWFSLHNGILNYIQEYGLEPSLIIRIPELKGSFTHEDYEQRLFTGTNLISLKNFSDINDVVCFERLVITPWAYSTNAFRCKMSDSAKRLRKKCFDCKGKGLNGTRFMSFRRQVLSACSISDHSRSTDKSITNIVVQVRKPYIRRINDNLDKFSRVLQNADELIRGLHKEFPGAAVTKMVAEEMTLCDQIRLVYNTDVLMGVHGAGLVHLWWLQDHALLFEIVPSKQRSNPSFKMLASLTGRRYYGYERLRGPEKKITVDVADIVMELKKQY